MTFAGTIRPTNIDLPIIQTEDDFIAFAGLFETSVKVASGSTANRVVNMNYLKGELTIEVGDPVATRLVEFFKKNGIVAEQGPATTPSAKVFKIADLDAWRKLAVWGMDFNGSGVLRKLHEAEKSQAATASQARSA